MAEYSINERVDYVLGEIYRLKPDLLGVSVYIWNREMTLALCSKLKRGMPELVIVLGGPEVSFDSEERLKNNPELDAIVVGEGEETFTELVRALGSGENVEGLKAVPGLAYRSKPGIVTTPPRPVIVNLDETASPYQGDGVRPADWEELKNRTVYLEGSRGCPNTCQYCLSSVQPRVRYFSWERVRKDLDALVANGVTQVKFVDRTFNSSPERAQVLWEYLLEQYDQNASWRKTRFHFEIGADRLTPKNLELLQQVPQGYFQFEIGVQSTNPATRKAIRRSMDWEHLQRNVVTLREWNNIHLHLDLIAGLPHESYQRFRDSFNDVYRLRPHRLQLGFLKLLKGSGLRESAADYGYQYSPHPPYEVLESGDLSFREILRLRLIEDLVEKYHNPGRFAFSLGMMELWAEDAMSLYEAMADFWEENGIYRHNQSSSSLYLTLSGFAQSWLRSIDHSPLQPIFTELLKLDWLLQPGTNYLPEWLPETRVRDRKRLQQQVLQDERNLERHFPELRGMPAREVNKRVQVEFFECDVLEIARGIENGSIDRDKIRGFKPALHAVGFKQEGGEKERFRLVMP
jgi:radical SAM superfamily enzyme YgiQ (UPF0313 family)